jgi:hypothetical protein
MKRLLLVMFLIFGVMQLAGAQRKPKIANPNIDMQAT